MNLSENDIEKIWRRFIQKTSPSLVKNLKPIKNLLGSTEKHKKLFMEAFIQYTKEEE